MNRHVLPGALDNVVSAFTDTAFHLTKQGTHSTVWLATFRRTTVDLLRQLPVVQQPVPLAVVVCIYQHVACTDIAMDDASFISCSMGCIQQYNQPLRYDTISTTHLVDNNTEPGTTLRNSLGTLPGAVPPPSLQVGSANASSEEASPGQGGTPASDPATP